MQEENPEDQDEFDDKKKKVKKGKKEKDKKKKAAVSLTEIPVIKKEKPAEMEPNIKIEGLKNVKLTSLTQKILGCIVGEHVTAESPWLTINKVLVDENLYLHHESSDFLPLKDDLAAYNDTTLLIGYDPDYIPYEGEDFHRFYVAVTEKAREHLTARLDEEKREAEERLRNSINKKVLPWKSMGSEVEVDFSTTKNTRPLIELQLETDIDELLRPIQFRDRNVEDAKDGYVAIGPGRQEFAAIKKRRVDASVQAVPVLAPHFAQTDPGIQMNAWTQYVYDMDTAEEAIKRGGAAAELRPGFAFAEEDYLQKSLEYNETFDLYTNDYPLLKKGYGDERIQGISLFDEYQAYTDVKHCKKMLISSIAWHPMWTGVVALSYSSAVRCLAANDNDPTVDQPSRDVYSKNPVLVWSFKDSLKPRLVLQSPREVYTIAWCPIDPNILVGGCASGQIIIWDLKGKLEAVEGHEYLSPDQQRYRLAMETLVGWLKPQAPAKYVRPAALSNIQLSHQGRVTALQWLPPYYEWNDYGHLTVIPVVEGRTSMQVVSCSEDGVVLVWDLNKLSPDPGPGRPKKKKARKRPSALTAQISPFKAGDRKFRPIYMLYPDSTDVKVLRKLTTLSVKSIPVTYELDTTVPEGKRDDGKGDAGEEGRGENYEDDYIHEKTYSKDGDSEDFVVPSESLESVNHPDNITYRETYKPVLFATDCEPQRQLEVTTDEGQTMTLEWEGYDFHKGEEITTEAGKIINSSRGIHDGPITTCARSPFINDLILTIGGKVTAIWTEEMKGYPLFWKAANVRVTCGSWSPYRPCMFHVGRADGSLEVWDFTIRSDVPILVQSISGQVLTTMNEHPLPLQGGEGILGVADYINSFRLLFFPKEYKVPVQNEVKTLKKFVDLAVRIRHTYKAWNEAFLKANADELHKQRALEEAEEKMRREAEQQAEVEMQMRAKLEEEETKRLAKGKSGLASISDRYFERLKEEREKQMQRVLMEKKRLDKKELMAKQQPILVMKQMEKEKRKKQREKVRQQQKIFDKTVAMLFPEVVEKPREGPTRLDAFEAEVMAQQSVLMKEFEDMVPTHMKQIKDNPFNKKLRWDKLFAEGRERRNILDFPLYLRQKRLERYVARNEPRFKFTLGQPQPYDGAEYKRKPKVVFKDDFALNVSDTDIEMEGEGEEGLFAEDDEENEGVRDSGVEA